MHSRRVGVIVSGSLVGGLEMKLDEWSLWGYWFRRSLSPRFGIGDVLSKLRCIQIDLGGEAQMDG